MDFGRESGFLVFLLLYMLAPIADSFPSLKRSIWQTGDLDRLLDNSVAVEEMAEMLAGMEEDFGHDLAEQMKLFEQVESQLSEHQKGLQNLPDNYKTSSSDVQNLGDKTIVTNRTIIKNKSGKGGGVAIIEEKEIHKNPGDSSGANSKNGSNKPASPFFLTSDKTEAQPKTLWPQSASEAENVHGHGTSHFEQRRRNDVGRDF